MAGDPGQLIQDASAPHGVTHDIAHPWPGLRRLRIRRAVSGRRRQIQQDIADFVLFGRGLLAWSLGYTLNTSADVLRAGLEPPGLFLGGLLWCELAHKNSPL